MTHQSTGRRRSPQSRPRHAVSGVRYLAIYSACAWKVRVLTND